MKAGPKNPKKYVEVPGKLVMLGFGSIGQSVLPLLFRHLKLKPAQVVVISAVEDETGIAKEFGVELRVNPLTEQNYLSVLEPLLTEGDFLLNLSVDVSSL